MEILLKNVIKAKKEDERARWDLNPRSPAPKADTLIRARLRAPEPYNSIMELH